MSCAPGIIFARRSKKNPYADRGLAEFALLSAELDAKRKKLVGLLGRAPLSFVRFTSGSDEKNWIPIIICPTLSSEEVRTLQRAAASLISEDKGSLIAGKPNQTGNARRGSLRKGAQNHPSDVNSGEEAHATAISSVGRLTHIFAAMDKLLWMAAFGLSIVADIFRSFFGLKTHTDVSLRRTPRQEIVHNHNSSVKMASSAHAPSLPPLKTAHTKMPPQHIKTDGPSQLLHVKVPKGHIKWKNAGCSTAPSTPTDSRHHKKELLTSVSFPKTRALEEQGITKEKQLCGTVSLPRMTMHWKESNLHIDSTTNKAETKKKAEKLGQALTGVGVVLGLGGLVMGYLPAIVSIVCWWYVLPTLRKAVGDKPNIVKSHHHKQ